MFSKIEVHSTLQTPTQQTQSLAPYPQPQLIILKSSHDQNVGQSRAGTTLALPTGALLVFAWGAGSEVFEHTGEAAAGRALHMLVRGITFVIQPCKRNGEMSV